MGQNLSPSADANSSPWKDIPHRHLARRCRALDTAIEMLHVQILLAVGQFGCGLSRADLGDLLIRQQLQDGISSNVLGALPRQDLPDSLI